MSPGAHLSHAARLALDSQRALLAVLLHLESSGYEFTDQPGEAIAGLVATAGELTKALQRLADEYGQSLALERFR